MRVSDKISRVKFSGGFYFFGEKAKADEIFKICEQSREQEYMQVPQDGGKMRVLYRANTKIRSNMKVEIKRAGKKKFPARIFFVRYYQKTKSICNI